MATMAEKIEERLARAALQSPKTALIYGAIGRRLVSSLGVDPAPPEVLAYVAARAKIRRANSVNLDIAFLCQLGYPLKKLRVNDQKERPVLTVEQTWDIANECNPDVRDYVIALSYLGCRKEELFAVEWSDISADSVRLCNFKTSKSQADRYRSVPIHPELRKVLDRRRELPRPFPNRGCKDWLQYNVKVAAEKAGIKDMRLHDLRHAFATTLSAKGVDLWTISGLLGHKSVQNTQRYAHHTMAGKTAAVANL